MQYEGGIYGKVGRKYFPISTTKEVVKKSEVMEKLSAEILRIENEYKIEGLKIAMAIVANCS